MHKNHIFSIHSCVHALIGRLCSLVVLHSDTMYVSMQVSLWYNDESCRQICSIDRCKRSWDRTSICCCFMLFILTAVRWNVSVIFVCILWLLRMLNAIHMFIVQFFRELSVQLVFTFYWLYYLGLGLFNSLIYSSPVQWIAAKYFLPLRRFFLCSVKCFLCVKSPDKCNSIWCFLWLAEVLEYYSESPSLDSMLKNIACVSSNTWSLSKGLLCRRNGRIQFCCTVCGYPVSSDPNLRAREQNRVAVFAQWQSLGREETVCIV